MIKRRMKSRNYKSVSRYIGERRNTFIIRESVWLTPCITKIRLSVALRKAFEDLLYKSIQGGVVSLLILIKPYSRNPYSRTTGTDWWCTECFTISDSNANLLRNFLSKWRILTVWGVCGPHHQSNAAFLHFVRPSRKYCEKSHPPLKRRVYSTSFVFISEGADPGETKGTPPPPPSNSKKNALKK